MPWGLASGAFFRAPIWAQTSLMQEDDIAASGKIATACKDFLIVGFLLLSAPFINLETILCKLHPWNEAMAFSHSVLWEMEQRGGREGQRETAYERAPAQGATAVAVSALFSNPSCHDGHCISRQTGGQTGGWAGS